MPIICNHRAMAIQARTNSAVSYGFYARYLCAMVLAGAILWPGLVGGAECQFTTRPFLMGFSTLPSSTTVEGWNDLYAVLRSDADLAGQNLQEGIPWKAAAASGDVSTYPEALRARWSTYRSARQAEFPNHALYLMLNPIALDYQGLAPDWGGTVPESPWDTYAFNHPQVKAAVLNYATAAIRYFKPRYVSIGVEANILLARAPEKWAAYKKLNTHVLRALKRRFPDVKVFPTVQYEYLLGKHPGSASPEKQVAEVRELLRYADLLALSTYPYMVYLNEPKPGYYDPALGLAAELGKPLAIEQTGYTTRNIHIPDPFNVDIYGSQRLQRDFIGYLLNLACAQGFEFVMNFVPVDYGLNYSTDPAGLAWAYTGLLTTNGRHKAAWTPWNGFFKLPYQPVP